MRDLKKYKKSLANFKELKEAIKILKEHNINILAHYGIWK